MTVRRRSVLCAAAVLAFVVPDSALAHGSLTPTSAGTGNRQRFVVTIPTDRLSIPVSAFTLRAPPGVRLVSAQVPASPWTATVAGDTVRWEGGPSKDAYFDLFSFDAILPDEEGDVKFVGRETYTSGAGPEFPLSVTVVRGIGVQTPSTPATGGSTPIVVAVVGVVLIVALGLAAFLLLRGSRGSNAGARRAR